MKDFIKVTSYCFIVFLGYVCSVLARNFQLYVEKIDIFPFLCMGLFIAGMFINFYGSKYLIKFFALKKIKTYKDHGDGDDGTFLSEKMIR